MATSSSSPFSSAQPHPLPQQQLRKRASKDLGAAGVDDQGVDVQHLASPITQCVPSSCASSSTSSRDLEEKDEAPATKRAKQTSHIEQHQNIGNYVEPQVLETWQEEGSRCFVDEVPGLAADATDEWKKEFRWERKIQQANRRVFGNRTFRTNQREVINATMSKRDCFVLMPTGAGKSLCYQLPTICHDGVTVVILPRTSLIQDQITFLLHLGIPAAHLGADTPLAEANKIYTELHCHDPCLKLLYVTPEEVILNPKLQSALDSLYHNGNFQRVVIDEAHCVSQWGQEFTEDYAELQFLKQTYPDVPMIALTAAATKRVQTDIIRGMGLRDCISFSMSFNRSNLIYEVKEKSESVIKDIAQWIDNNYHGMSGIIYCLSRNECESVAERLYTDHQMNVASCHADMSSEERERIQMDWSSDRVNVIVATSAFDIGIRKPNVRFVIHFTLPKSLESYYQESGRAGIDGVEASCLLYYTYADKARVQHTLIENCSGEKARASINNDLYRIISFCENRIDCRRKLQLQHFGESFDLIHCRQTCDNCINVASSSISIRDFTDEAQAAVDIVRCTGGGFNLTHICDVLRGFLSKPIKLKLTRLGIVNIRGQGKGKGLAKVDCRRLLHQLVLDGILAEETSVQQHSGRIVSHIKLGPRASNLERGKLSVKLSFLSKQATTEMVPLPHAMLAAGQQEATTEELFEILHELRKKLCRESTLALMPHMIFNSRELLEIARLMPTNTREFQAIRGLSQEKLQSYSERFTSVIADFLERNPHARLVKANNLPEQSSRIELNAEVTAHQPTSTYAGDGAASNRDASARHVAQNSSVIAVKADPHFVASPRPSSPPSSASSSLNSSEEGC